MPPRVAARVDGSSLLVRTGYHTNTQQEFTVKDSTFTRNDELPICRPSRRSPQTPCWQIEGTAIGTTEMQRVRPSSSRPVINLSVRLFHSFPNVAENVQLGSTPCVANKHERNGHLTLHCYSNLSFQPLALFVSVMVAPNVSV